MSISDQAYIKGGLAQWMLQGQPIVMMTVTEGSEPRPFEVAAAAMTELLSALRRRHGGPFPYVVIPEPHRGGVVHWHVLMGGFVYRRATTGKTGRRWPGHPRDQVGVKLTKAELGELYARYGFGTGFTGLRAVGVVDPAFIASIRDSLGGRNISDEQAAGLAHEGTLEATSRYLSKYLTKAGPALAIPKGFPLLRHSQGAAAWWPGHDLLSLRQVGSRRSLAPGLDERVRAEWRAATLLVRAFDSSPWGYEWDQDVLPLEHRPIPPTFAGRPASTSAPPGR